jgi:trans-2,3-dihydro-3-hydroxyanthranilate isomerase
MCDVFAERPLNGNSLSVVLHDEPLEPELMQALTRELRQFETVFLRPTSEPQRFETHVFDLTPRSQRRPTDEILPPDRSMD